MQSDQDILLQQLLVTVPQAAKLLGLSRATVYALLAQGQGPPVIKFGRSVRVSVASLKKWIEEQESDQQSLE